MFEPACSRVSCCLRDGSGGRGPDVRMRSRVLSTCCGSPWDPPVQRPTGRPVHAAWKDLGRPSADIAQTKWYCSLVGRSRYRLRYCLRARFCLPPTAGPNGMTTIIGKVFLPAIRLSRNEICAARRRPAGESSQIVGDRFGNVGQRSLFVSAAPGGEVVPVGAVSTQGVDRLRSEKKSAGLRLPCRQRVRDRGREGRFRGEAPSLPCCAVSGEESIPG
jgi:hypothetical protein